MKDELDYELTSDQWETLKALRSPATSILRINRFAGIAAHNDYFF